MRAESASVVLAAVLMFTTLVGLHAQRVGPFPPGGSSVLQEYESIRRALPPCPRVSELLPLRQRLWDAKEWEPFTSISAYVAACDLNDNALLSEAEQAERARHAISILEEVLGALGDSVRSSSSVSPERAMIYWLLGQASCHRSLDSTPAIEAGIRYSSLAVDATRAAEEGGSLARGFLGTCLMRRQLGASQENAERAIAQFQQAQTFFTLQRDPSTWVRYEENIARGFLRWSTFVPEKRTEAVAHFRAALANVPAREEALRRQVSSGLVEALASSQDLSDRLEAVRIARAMLTPSGPIAPSNTSQALAYRALGMAYDGLAGASDESLGLLKAVAAGERRVELLDADRERARWLDSMTDLASHQLALANLWEGDAYLEKARTTLELALEKTNDTAHARVWLRTHLVLGFVYANRLAGNRRSNLNRALQHSQTAVETARRLGAESEIRNASQLELAVRTFIAEHDGDQAQVRRAHESAIAAYDQMLTAPGSSLPMDIRWGLELNRAKSLARLAALGERLAGTQAREALQRLLMTPRLASAEDLVGAHVRLAELAGVDGRWADCIEAAQTALAIADEQVSRAVTERGRLLTADPKSDAAMTGALCAARGGNPSLAFSLVYRSSTLGRIDAALRSGFGLPNDLFMTQTFDITPEGKVTTRSAESFNYQELYQRAVALLEEGHPDYARVFRLLLDGRAGLLRKLELDGAAAGAFAIEPLVRRLLPEGGALVLPIVGDVTALLCTVRIGNEVTTYVKTVDTFSDRDLNGLVRGSGSDAGWTAAVTSDNGEVGPSGAVGTLLKSLPARLGRTLIGAIDQALRERGVPARSPLVLVLPGTMAALPLHAVAFDAAGTTLVDRYVVSYLPHLLALQALPESSIQATRPATFLTLSNPELPLGRAESTLVAQLLVRRGMKPAQVGTPTLELRNTEYVHLAGHGVTDGRDPLSASIELGAGRALSTRDISRMAPLTGIRVAVLSACSTDVRSTALAVDEQLSLATALFTAGARGVVATQWSVQELASTLLTLRFFDAMGVSKEQPAVALRTAQLWLRAATRQEVGRYLTAFGTSARSLRDYLARTPGERPFADPFYWASYRLVGG